MSKPLEVRIFNRLFEKDKYHLVDIKEYLWNIPSDGPDTRQGHIAFYNKVKEHIIAVIKEEINKEPTK